VANGLVSLDGMYLRSVLTMTQLPRFFEARARLMQSPDTSGNVDLGFYREIGPLYNPFTPASSIRLFILGNSDSNNLIVRARDGDGQMADVDIPDPDETQFHVFRIEWEPEVTRYYIDGALQSTILSSTQVVTSWVFLYHQTPSFYGSTPTDIDGVRAG
jgi:beta-glucanase (GH16 family)